MPWNPKVIPCSKCRPTSSHSVNTEPQWPHWLVRCQYYRFSAILSFMLDSVGLCVVIVMTDTWSHRGVWCVRCVKEHLTAQGLTRFQFRRWLRVRTTAPSRHHEKPALGLLRDFKTKADGNYTGKSKTFNSGYVIKSLKHCRDHLRISTQRGIEAEIKFNRNQGIKIYLNRQKIKVHKVALAE